MKDRIVAADSTSCLDFADIKHNIETLPLYLHMQGLRLRDVQDISAQEFMAWMNQHPNELPHSTPPDIKDLCDLYESWIERGIKEVIFITLSSRISETYAIASLAAKKYQSQIHIEVFDSLTTLYGQALLALEAEKLMDKGLPLKTIMLQLQFMRSRDRFFFTVGSLDYFVKSGRLSATKGFFGNMLQIKPVFYFNEKGKITLQDNVRKLDQAQQHVIEQVQSYVKNRLADLYIIRPFDREGMIFESEIKKLFPKNHTISLPPSPVIACNTGPTLYGLGVHVQYGNNAN